MTPLASAIEILLIVIVHGGAQPPCLCLPNPPVLSGWVNVDEATMRKGRCLAKVLHHWVGLGGALPW